MTRKAATEHVLVGNTPDGGMMVWCRHCGAKQQVPLPMPITGRGGFVAWQRRWTAAHLSCPRPVNLYPPPAEVIEADVRRRIREGEGAAPRSITAGIGVGTLHAGGDTDVG